MRKSRKVLLIFAGGTILLSFVFLWLTSPMTTSKNDVLSDTNYYIAHATGALNGQTYLNCKEALLQSLNNGYNYIELDLGLTTDSVLVCIHDWAHFHAITTNDTTNKNPISANEFLRRKIKGKYTPLTLKQAIRIKEKHPYIIVTDKISDTKVLNRYFRQDRHHVMVEAFSLLDYVELKKAGYIPMLSLWSFDYSQIFWVTYYYVRYQIKIEWICVHSSSNMKSIRMLKRLFGCKVAMYSCNSPSFFIEHLGKEVDLIYTDNWNPKTQKNNDTLQTAVY